MQYIHQTTYGHLGGVHTMKPMYAIKTSATGTQGIYRTAYHPEGESHVADYHVENGKIYSASDGAKRALYTIQGNQIHTTVNNLHHNPDASHVLDIRAHE